MIVDLILLLATAVVAYLAYKQKSKAYKNLPPGPWSIPILGHLPVLGENPAKTLLKWKETYGNIISVRFGSFPAVVINDANLIKTAFNLPVFSGRPHIKLLDDWTKGRRGFMLSDGHNAAEQRQFLKRNLKDFGYANMTMESIVTDQISNLVVALEQKNEKSFGIKQVFNGYTVNSLWSIVSGCPFDPKTNTCSQLVDAVAKQETNTRIHLIAHSLILHNSELSYFERNSTFPRVIDQLMIFIPAIAVWFPNWSGYNEKIKNAYGVQDFIEEQIGQVRATRTPNQPRVVLDAYLDKVEETTDTQSSFHEKYNNVVLSTQDLFSAGVETTSTALEWTFFYMCKYPQVQKRLQSEIDNVIGSSRLPTTSDKFQMPYTEAVINEILRIATLLPLSLFHSTMEDVEFEGFTIPKNTMVLANLYAAHNDPAVWGDPRTFRPERFLDKDLKSLIKVPEFIPFSWGKRNCIGEHLARLQLFLYITSIFQKFNVEASGPLPSEDGNYGFTFTSHPFDVIVKKREGNN